MKAVPVKGGSETVLTFEGNLNPKEVEALDAVATFMQKDADPEVEWSESDRAAIVAQVLHKIGMPTRPKDMLYPNPPSKETVDKAMYVLRRTFAWLATEHGRATPLAVSEFLKWAEQAAS